MVVNSGGNEQVSKIRGGEESEASNVLEMKEGPHVLFFLLFKIYIYFDSLICDS